MARKIPDCAWCGKPLKDSGEATIQINFGDAIGSPIIGWHEDCAEKDEDVFDVAQECMGSANMDGPPENWEPWAVVQVLHRGRSRVTAGSLYWIWLSMRKELKR